MVAMIRPTLVLKMDLDEEAFSEAVAAEIKRSFSYVAQAMVVNHEPGGAERENILRFMVKMRLPYWYSTDEGADELWSEVMVQWLENMFSKVSSTIVSSNALRDEAGETPILYDVLEIEFGEDALVTVPFNGEQAIPEEALGLVEQARAEANAKG